MATCPDGHESGATDYCDVCGTMMSGSAAPAAASASASAPSSGPGTGGEGRTSCPDCQAPRTGRFCEECGYDFAIEVSGAVRMAAQQSASAQVQRPAAWSRPIPGTSGASSMSARQVPGGTLPPTATYPSAAQYPSSPQYAPQPPYQQPTGPMPTGPVPSPAPGTWEAIVTADRAYYDSVIAQGGPDAASVAFPPYCPERRFPVQGQQVRIGRASRSRGLTPEIDLSGPPQDPGVSHLHAVLLAQPDGSWLLVDPGSANGTTVNGASEPLEPNVPVPVGDGDRIQLGAWTVITLRKG
ncbi:hypothetical protein HNP84_009869 [Thermocatellispora tengchongensis]|uniref:FHA domain-containing protein n=1 Tax=Thermocatellispora tengchongensis TaxID=1073253 RepID=A0A840PFA6_9ACTN|nr:FHA domain-containing protein [Thermocatellispora tengchongensis]MBB5140104.1 hypothetical protein [Thermocatellispora tengchongensis]